MHLSELLSSGIVMANRLNKWLSIFWVKQLLIIK